MADNQYIYDLAKERGLDVSKLPNDPATCWVMKALDPASEKCGPLTGIPDLNNEATVVIEWRQIDQVIPPTGLAATDTWEGDYCTFPGPAILGIYRTRKTGATTWNYTLVLNKQYTWGSTQPNFTSAGITGGNPGKWINDVTGYRVMYASSTGVFNGADLSNQGTIVGGQTPTPYLYNAYSNVAGTTGTGANPVPLTGTGTEAVWLQAVLRNAGPTYDSIMQICPRGEMSRAKEGWYQPLRLTNVSANTPFTSAGEVLAVMDDPWLNQTTVNSLAGWVPVPVPGNAQLGFVSWRGIAATSTYAVTSRVGYECTLNTSTAFRSFVTASCPPDFALVQEYSRINAMIGDMYPSKYNSYDILGKIIEQLAQHMPAPWNTIVPLLGKAAGGIARAATGKGKKSKPVPSKGKAMPGGGRKYPGGLRITEVPNSGRR